MPSDPTPFIASIVTVHSLQSFEATSITFQTIGFSQKFANKPVFRIRIVLKGILIRGSGASLFFRGFQRYQKTVLRLYCSFFLKLFFITCVYHGYHTFTLVSKLKDICKYTPTVISKQKTLEKADCFQLVSFLYLENHKKRRIR
jgi:hypothetical protein